MTYIAIHNEPHSFLPAKHGNHNRCQTCGGWEESPCHSPEVLTPHLEPQNRSTGQYGAEMSIVEQPEKDNDGLFANRIEGAGAVLHGFLPAER